MTGPAVALEGVAYRYPASGAGVADLSLTVAEGEIVAVIGPSGCGKTTLLKLVAGFLRPDRGIVRLGGSDSAAVPPRNRNLGLVFQSYALFPHMTAWQNVAYPLKVRGVALAKRRDAAFRMLGTVGLGGLEERRPGEFSGGQQQRVALARALVFGPRALLLDEPLSALDAALRLEMRDEIRRIQRAHGTATLHITHDQEEALSLADRVAVMRGGRIEQVGTPREIYDAPVSRAVAAFVGHANLWPGKVLAADAVETSLGVLKATTHGFAPGAAVTILVRPERVRPARPGSGANVLAGRLARDRFLGSLRRFDLLVGSTTIVGETLDPGDIEAVAIPPEHVRLIPGHDQQGRPS